MKKGITLVSIIIYLVLFSTFTAFALSVSSNMNRNVLKDKASSILEVDYSKVYTNLFNSAKASKSYYVADSNVYFSNGDVYKFDSVSSLLYKNESVICDDIDKFTLFNPQDIKGTNLSADALSRCESLCVDITLKKYEVSITRQIVITTGDDANE